LPFYLFILSFIKETLHALIILIIDDKITIINNLEKKMEKEESIKNNKIKMLHQTRFYETGNIMVNDSRVFLHY
jgi:hypothetical protein